ncbi:glycosyl hydrolase family 18 protein [Clostridiaceae bacterium M8S5]|nr:glycosyl hydrolase family 18 protein [Clostridiaceae bacterium M8S5]
MKKIFYSILVSIAVVTYVLVYHTNLVAEPVFNANKEDEIVINGEPLHYEITPINDNKNIYLDYQIIKDKLGMDILWDKNNQTLIYCKKDKVIRVYNKKNQIKENTKVISVNDILKTFQGAPILSSSFVEKHTDYKISYKKESKTYIVDEPNVAVKGKIENGTRLRLKTSVWSDVLDKMNTGEDIYIYKTLDNWSYIRNERGFYGYIKNSDYSKMKQNIPEAKEDIDKKEEVYLEDGLLNVTWEYVGRKRKAPVTMEKIEGLDVICPTWFSIDNEDGFIKDKASLQYSREAHRVGYKIWGLVDNSFNPDMTAKILNNSLKREKVINKIIEFARKYELDGINIDFENVYLKEKDMLTQFMKEFYPICKENNLKLSIDVTPKSKSENWSMFYDRSKLGEVVDYMILMAYDEHWKSCPTSGSVASLPWVERGLENLMTMVDKKKIILGVPFYTRLWKEINQDGKIKTSAKDYSMHTIEKILQEKEIKIVWDEESKQDYIEFVEDDKTYKVWLENSKSMEKRIELVRKHDIKGVASWRKGFEKKEIWRVINRELHKVNN